MKPENYRKNALNALDESLGCPLTHHGVIALGHNLAKALWLAREIETLAKQYFIPSQYGKPKIIDDDEMDRVLAAFKGYGPNRSDD